MNEINMANLNAVGGVPGGIHITNNGNRSQMPIINDQRSQLNTYIYEYFLRNGMYECAKALLESGQPLNVMKDSLNRRRDDIGNSDKSGEDLKEDYDRKRSHELPEPNVPKECPESCFLYEWWCLFWEMFNAQRNKSEGRAVLQYFTHTQAQSRSKQEQQQMMLRGMRGEMSGIRGEMSYHPQFNPMIRNQHNGGMTINPPNDLRQKALHNNNRNPTPAQMQMLQQQQKHQMQRDPSTSESQRAQSPTSAENVPSPSKRPRLDGAGFSSQMPNGRGQGGGIHQQVWPTRYSHPLNDAARLREAHKTELGNLTGLQFQSIAGAPTAAAQRLAGYQASLGQHQQSQMPNVKSAMVVANGPQARGSPMISQGQQDGGNVPSYYNTSELGPNAMRAPPGGQPGGNSSHALQDYQMQLMLLEQQNKKRLMMARQEQDSTAPRPIGSQVPQGAVPNGQNFQGTSPQGARSVNSPNPGDQIKRTSHMNTTGMPSPLPDGPSRSSPTASMGFNMAAAPMDPSINQQYFNKVNGMDPNMVSALPNGMRPPSSHPSNFNQMSSAAQTHMALTARQQHAMHHQQAQHQAQQHAQQQAQQQQQAQHQQNWQSGPNGQPMMTQPSQGQNSSQQVIGTPQLRNMPPPSMSAVSGPQNSNSRTPQATVSPGQTPAPPTPQQANKANPKKKSEAKENKMKRAQKKGSAANVNAGTTPSADAETTGATPTPATPMTPIHKQRFNGGQNNTVQPATNGQVSGPSANIGMSQQQDPLQGGGFGLNDSSFPNFETSLDFANPGNGNMDVLQDFDFDSFLHQDAGDPVNEFNFDPSFLDGNEISAD